jgi:UDP-N-acetylmuramoylalanine--D-glutamate ligase
MLHGPHNKQNAAIAYAATKALGLSAEGILESMKSFAGLPHRQYPVRVINGVAYINDSKATNGEAAGKALGCNHNIYWILGGRDKEGGLDGLQIFADRIKHAFLIGESADKFSDWLMQYGVDSTKSGTIDIAVRQAHKKAQDNRGQPGGAGVVLLSPACSSYDQFKNFEERGDMFTKLVLALEEEGGSA